MNEQFNKSAALSGIRTSQLSISLIFNLALYHRLMIVVLAGGGLLLGLLFAVIAPRSYTATVRLVPASSGLEYAPNSGLGGVAGALSGLGIQLPKSSSGSDFILFPQVLGSSAVANAILQRKDLIAKMFPAEYDRETRTFHQPRGVMWLLNNVFWSLFGQPGYVPPNTERVRNYIQQNVSIQEASVSAPITTLTFSHGDRAFANEFLLILWKSTDQQLRTWRVRAAQDNSDYLERKLGSVASVDYRSALIAQLVPQVMTVMVSNPNSPFAARIIDGPSAGSRPTKPNPPLLIILGLFFGMVTAAGLILARLSFSRFPLVELIVRRLNFENGT